MYREGSLRTCLEDLERTGDFERLTQQYPQFGQEMQSFLNTRRLLDGTIPQLDNDRLLNLKHEFLRTITAARPKGVFGMLPVRLAALLGIGGVLVAASLGASAAGLGPAPRAGEVLESMGVHGRSVSDAVHEAIEGTSAGPERGEAVSAAACEAAHDRSTLPQGAQDAPGQEDKETKDCSKSNEKPDNASERANEAGPSQDLQSIEPGPERGMAACAAATQHSSSQGQAAEHAQAKSEPACEPASMEGSAGESGQGSGGKPADLPAPASGRH
jgi:hypothetical protein